MVRRMFAMCCLLTLVASVGCSQESRQTGEWHSWLWSSSTTAMTPEDQRINDLVDQNVARQVKDLQDARDALVARQNAELDRKKQETSNMNAAIDAAVQAQIDSVKQSRVAIEAKRRQDALAAQQSANMQMGIPMPASIQVTPNPNATVPATIQLNTNPTAPVAAPAIQPVR